jgi:hypothetical protein
VGEFSRFSDFPSGGILWFDRRRAIENRLARKITEDNRAEPSLPPSRVRDVVVDERRLDELYSENAATSEGTAEAIALASDPAAKRISLRADGQRRLPQKVSKRSAAADWLLCSYPDGIPAGMTDKKLCRDFEEKTETKIDPRTMRRAMGKK